jgi:hypothetical protein
MRADVIRQCACYARAAIGHHHRAAEQGDELAPFHVQHGASFPRRPVGVPSQLPAGEIVLN